MSRCADALAPFDDIKVEALHEHSDQELSNASGKCGDVAIHASRMHGRRQQVLLKGSHPPQERTCMHRLRKVAYDSKTCIVCTKYTCQTPRTSWLPPSTFCRRLTSYLCRLE